MPTAAPGRGAGVCARHDLHPALGRRQSQPVLLAEYRKVPYFAKSSDFSSAGAADIEYRTRLDAPFAQLTLGEHGYRRGVLGGSAQLLPDTPVRAAIELMGNDGPWTVKEGLHRANGLLSASGGNAGQGWQASLMGYDAR